MQITMQAYDVVGNYLGYTPQGIRTSSDDNRERERKPTLEIVGRFALKTSTLMC